MRNALTVLVYVVLGGGCYLGALPESVDAGPTTSRLDPSWELSLSPTDLATGVNVENDEFSMPALCVSFTDKGQKGRPEHLEAVANGLRLQTYPEMQDVPFDVRGCHLDELVDGGESLLPLSARCKRTSSEFLELLPRSPLTEGWYVVSLTDIPGRMTATTSGGPNPTPGLRLSNRFRVGSAPMVRGVDVCSGRDRRRVATVHFSEGITYEGASVPAMSLTAPDGTLCELDSNTPTFRPGLRFGMLSYSCDVANVQGTWRFEAADGLFSTTGEPLRTYSGAVPVSIEWTSEELLPNTRCVNWWAAP